MKRSVSIAVLAVAPAVLLLPPVASGQSEAEVEGITRAMPEKPPAKPAGPRKLLVFSKCKGFRHSSIPIAAKAIEIMGEKTGAFTATLTDDEAMFEPDKLAGFDAVLLNNTTGELLAPSGKQLRGKSEQEVAQMNATGQRRRKALLDFVRSGKGLIGIHAATDCSYRWREYGRMMGGYFDGHPWGAGTTVTVRVDEPDHPINAAFDGERFRVKDEIYQFGPGRSGWDAYSRATHRVLLTLDVDASPKKRGMKRKDGDYAISWVKTYGDGRVFYCSLGHNKEIFRTRPILAHYLAGIQYALGDLEADDSSSDPTVGDWRVLFDGEDLGAFDNPKGEWTVEDGAIAWNKGAGFLWTKETFGDFVLSLEFKVSPKANSGVFLRTKSRKNWLHSGIEVQILDSHGREKVGKHDCGAIYDCLAPSTNAVRPAGEWNRMVVTCRANEIQVVMNDRQIIDMDLNRWPEAHRNPDGTRNKFNTAYKDMPREGFIGFQDHGHPVWYRDVRIRELE